jgi:uncharacterized DUF497 family protein
MIYIVYHIEVKYFDWDESKNEWLIKNRGVSFELCLVYIQRGDILEILENHEPYEHQKIFIINIEGYVYQVPYVEDEEKIFLKTIYPSRKATKKYLQ